MSMDLEEKRKITKFNLLRTNLLDLVYKNREFHSYVPDGRSRYLILKILAEVTPIFYITKNEHTTAIANFLNQWNDFGLEVESAIYPKDSVDKRFTARLVVASEDYIQQKLTNSKKLDFTQIIVFEEGIELTSEGRYIHQIWKNYTGNKPRLVYFSRPIINRKIPGFFHRDIQTVIVYLNTNPPIDQLFDRTSSLILKQYSTLERGCCILVFVSNIDQELELRDRLFQVNDYIISTISDGKLNTLPTTKTSFRPHIIITNHEHDIRSLSDVSIVIDMMMEEHNNEIRYISKHKARLRLERVTMEGGRCYRMITFDSYLVLPEFYNKQIKGHHQLALMDRSKDHFRGLEIELGKETHKKLFEQYFKLGLIDNKKQITELGLRASKISINPKTFYFVDAWNQKGYKIFPAVIIAALLEMGKHDYFFPPNNSNYLSRVIHHNRYEVYYGRDDISTYLNVYMDMLDNYGGFPNLSDVDDIVWLQNWADQRDLNYSALRKLTLDISRMLRDFNLIGYEFTLGSFNSERASNITREIVVETHTPVIWSKKKQFYEDTRGNKYIFGSDNYSTLQANEVENLIVLEYKINDRGETRYIILAMASEKTPPKIVPSPPNFSQMQSAMVTWSKFVSVIKPENYIDHGVGDEYIKNQDINTKFMGPKYEHLFDPTPPINTYTTRDGYIYTEDEIIAIESSLKSTDFSTQINIEPGSPELKSRSIELLDSAIVTWKQRGYLLLEKEYIVDMVKDNESVVYIGYLNKFLFVKFPKIEFYEIPIIENDELKNLGDVPKNSHLIISRGNDPSEYKKYIDLLKPKSALFVFKPNLEKTKYLHYPGVIKTVPFLDKESPETRIFVSEPHTKELIEYDTSKYLNQIYYHNLVHRQNLSYRPIVSFPGRENLKRPEKDYMARDTCYDCRREDSINDKYLERKYAGGQPYDKKLSIYSEIDELSFAIKHLRSLYYGMHGMFTDVNISERRKLYEDYKRTQIPKNRRTTAPGVRGVRLNY